MNFTQCSKFKRISKDVSTVLVQYSPLFVINSPNLLKVIFGIFIRTVILPWTYNGTDPLLQLGLQPRLTFTPARSAASHLQPPQLCPWPSSHLYRSVKPYTHHVNQNDGVESWRIILIVGSGDGNSFFQVGLRCRTSYRPKSVHSIAPPPSLKRYQSVKPYTDPVRHIHCVVW